MASSFENATGVTLFFVIPARAIMPIALAAAEKRWGPVNARQDKSILADILAKYNIRVPSEPHPTIRQQYHRTPPLHIAKKH